MIISPIRLSKTINSFSFITGSGKPESINIVDMFGATNPEILVRDQVLTWISQGWFDSIVQLNNPPEESELMLLDDEQKQIWN